MFSLVIPGKGKTGALHPAGKCRSLCALGSSCQGCAWKEQNVALSIYFMGKTPLIWQIQPSPSYFLYASLHSNFR